MSRSVLYLQSCASRTTRGSRNLCGCQVRACCCPFSLPCFFLWRITYHLLLSCPKLRKCCDEVSGVLASAVNHWYKLLVSQSSEEVCCVGGTSRKHVIMRYEVCAENEVVSTGSVPRGKCCGRINPCAPQCILGVLGVGEWKLCGMQQYSCRNLAHFALCLVCNLRMRWLELGMLMQHKLTCLCLACCSCVMLLSFLLCILFHFFRSPLQLGFS